MHFALRRGIPSLKYGEVSCDMSCIQQHMELRLYPSLETGFGQLCQRYSNKPAHFLFSKTILNVGRARAAIVDFAKYIYHRLGT